MRKNWQRFSLFVITVSFLVSFAVMRPQAVTEDRQAQDKLAKDYIQAMELVRENYVEELDYEPLTSAAIQGMLRVLA